MATLYLIFESAVGLGLFEVKNFDEANAKLPVIQKQIKSYETFSEMVRFKAFEQFDAASALESAKEIGLGNLTELLQNFIESNVPKQKKKGKVQLGFLDKSLAKTVSDQLGFECKVNDVVFELFRGLRAHFTSFLKQQDFSDSDLIKAQVGLTHQFSRSRIQFDVNRQDKPIIQSLAVLEQLDKDINTFSMRVKEWYGYHFPELAKICSDNNIYVKIVEKFGDKQNINDEALEEITAITLDEEISQMVVDAAKTSMGQEIAEFDEKNLVELAARVSKQFDFRKDIASYLRDRMEGVAPNLTSLIGENVGAKLISHAGGLSNLIKYPASTVQILGAEKALFRALKTKSNTPKYGLLYHSTYIGRAGGKEKGKISRYLANKCSLAARLDHFLLKPTDKFGIKMKSQVEERLKFFADGGQTAKNQDTMDTVLQELKDDNLYYDNEVDLAEAEKKAAKKSKKSKKNKKRSAEIDVEEVVEDAEQEGDDVVEKKKKKKKSKKNKAE